MNFIKYISVFFISFTLVSSSPASLKNKRAIIYPDLSPAASQAFRIVEDILHTQQTYEIAEPEDTIKHIKITAVGDLMVHTWQLNDAYDKETGEYDFSNDFEMVYDYLAPSDYTIGNLETVFAGAEIGYSDFPMFNTPDSFGYALKEAGFDLLTTANNHSMDKKEAGLLRTLDVLDTLEIAHVGTYRSFEESESFQITDINGIKTAFLSYTYGTNGIPVPKGKEYLINIISEEKIISDLKKVKELEPDLIIVMPHMGNEYETYTKQIFKNWADLMINNGADIVIASHPHVLQPMEIKEITEADGSQRNAFVIYSMGNFISSQRTEPRDYSMILNLSISQKDTEKPVIEKVSFIPTWVQFKNQQGMDYVRVLSVYDALSQYSEGIENNLRPKDITRLKRVHEEITKIYFGESISLEDMENEYTFYEKSTEYEPSGEKEYGN